MMEKVAFENALWLLQFLLLFSLYILCKKRIGIEMEKNAREMSTGRDFEN